MEPHDLEFVLRGDEGRKREEGWVGVREYGREEEGVGGWVAGGRCFGTVVLLRPRRWHGPQHTATHTHLLGREGAHHVAAIRAAGNFDVLPADVLYRMSTAAVEGVGVGV